MLLGRTGYVFDDTPRTIGQSVRQERVTVFSNDDCDDTLLLTLAYPAPIASFGHERVGTNLRQTQSVALVSVPTCSNRGILELRRRGLAVTTGRRCCFGRKTWSRKDDSSGHPDRNNSQGSKKEFLYDLGRECDEPPS